MTEKIWCIQIKNETAQEVRVKGYRTEGITDFKGDIPIVVKTNKTETCTFSTKRKDYTQEGGGLDIRTNV